MNSNFSLHAQQVPDPMDNQPSNSSAQNQLLDSPGDLSFSSKNLYPCESCKDKQQSSYRIRKFADNEQAEDKPHCCQTTVYVQKSLLQESYFFRDDSDSEHDESGLINLFNEVQWQTNVPGIEELASKCDHISHTNYYEKVSRLYTTVTFWYFGKK